ncbi:MAG: helix-turn-helix transcriptional regulator [Alphaproteobacteria bacterium]|nr:helix-turn-helix transcriptional regulator [Alphaproteobacteria bacterium]
MEIKTFDDLSSIAAFAALAQPTRLDVFRRLVRAEPEGLAAGEIARQCAAPHNTMSAHLAVLARAELVTQARQGRSIVYRADLARLRALTLFLLEDCCGGRPEICAPLAESLSACAGKSCTGADAMKSADGLKEDQAS